jgi:peroxiredoxin
MKLNLTTLLFLLPFFPAAQVAKITGTAPGAEGRRIEVVAAADLLTHLEKPLAEATVDSSGAFSLSFPLNRSISVTVAIDFHQSELFLEPGKNYSFAIAPLDYNAVTEENPFLESQSLDVMIANNRPDDLNSLIQSFNHEYNVFVLEHFNELYRDKQKARLDTFRVLMKRKFAGIKNDYFLDYMKYKTGSLEQVANIMGKSLMVKKYFSDAPILYDNVEYMDFFKEFFSGYITTTSRPLKFLNYNGMLNGPGSYAALMKALEADTLLRRPQLRELVLLRGMMEMYDDPQYRKESIQNLLSSISAESKFPENRLIAGDILKFLTRLRSGTPAPAFTLEDRNRKKVSLSDFRGKPVILGFWTTYCRVCLSQMEALKPLYDKYHDRMNFVSISADKEFVKMIFFLNLKKNFTWTFLHLGNNLGILKEYDVTSFPLFVLIDGQGKIVSCPADLPDSGLEPAIEKLLNP